MLLKSEARFAFCVAWWSTKAEARKHAKRVAAAGDRYRGGWCDGAFCGRAPEFDRDGAYAVTYDHVLP